MTKTEMALLIIAAIMFVLAILKLIELLAQLALQRLIDGFTSVMIGWRIELDEMNEMHRSVREKPPDGDPQASAESKAPMVKMAAETLRRRRSEATE